MQTETKPICAQSDQRCALNSLGATPHCAMVSTRPLVGCDKSTCSVECGNATADNTSVKSDRKSLAAKTTAEANEASTTKSSSLTSLSEHLLSSSATKALAGEVGQHVGGANVNQVCVRWCVNVALQSFREEPWAVNLRQIAFAGSCSSVSQEELHDKGMLRADEGIEVRSLPQSTSKTSAMFSQASENKSEASDSSLLDTDGSKPVSECSSNTSLVNLQLHHTKLRHQGKRGSNTSAVSRCGVQLCAVKWSQEEVVAALRTAGCDNARICRTELRKELKMLQRCLADVNDPPVIFANDELLRHFFNVEFVPSSCDLDPNKGAKGSQVSYSLRKPIETLLNNTLSPVISAVADRCVNAMSLMYGATREMRQLGLIGTPKALGLFPKGITMLMERYLAQNQQEEHQDACSSGHTQASRDKNEAFSSSQSGNGGGAHARGAAPTLSGCEDAKPDNGSDDGACCDDDGSGIDYFPFVESKTHRFVRAEVTFIAFDSRTVVDLLDLNNRNVELGLKFGTELGTSTADPVGEDETHAPDTILMTDSLILNAYVIPVESTNDAFCLLDVGIENFSHTLQKGLFESETNTSLLYSLTLHTDEGCAATMHMLCLAEDQTVQTWLSNTLAVYHHVVPTGGERRAASMAQVPPPPSLHHQAANLLLPAVYRGNLFVSVIVCVYNSITALLRVNRDLAVALTGYRVHTTPALPGQPRPGTTTTTTATAGGQPPRRRRSPRLPIASARWGWGGAKRSRGSPAGIPLADDDKDFLAVQHQRHSADPGRAPPAPSPTTAASDDKAGIVSEHPTAAAPMTTTTMTTTALPPVDISIVVMDTSDHLRVLLNARGGASDAELYREALNCPPRQRRPARAKGKPEGFRYTVASRGWKPAAGAALNVVSSVSSPTAMVGRKGGKEPPKVCDGDSNSRSTSSLSESTLFDGSQLTPTSVAGEEGLPTATVGGGPGVSMEVPEAVTTKWRAANDVFPKDGEEAESESSGAGYDGLAFSPVGAKVDSQPEHPFEKISEVIGTSKFYSNAMHEKVAVLAVGGSRISVQDSSFDKQIPSSYSPAGCVAVIDSQGGYQHETGSSSSHLHKTEKIEGEDALLTHLSPEAEDLESLLDEFSCFFKRSYENERRLKQLEAELARVQEKLACTRGGASDIVPRHITPEDGSCDAMPDLIDSRILVQHMEERLRSVGTHVLRERLKASINEAKAQKNPTEALPRGLYSRTVCEGETGSEGHNNVLKLWDAIIEYSREVEQQQQSKTPIEWKGMLAQLAKDHQALLSGWARGYEDTIHTLEAENARLQQLNEQRNGAIANNGRSLDSSLSLPLEASAYRTSVPFSLPEILAQHQELFDTLMYTK